MNWELVFGLTIVLLLVAWGLWMLAISKGSRAGMVGGFVGVLVLCVCVVLVNGRRSDVKLEEYRTSIERFIDAVSASQEAAFEEDGEYLDELPEIDEALLAFDAGLFQTETELEPALEVSRNGYTVTGTMGDQTYSLEVERIDEGTTEERTCSAAETAGCLAGEWEPGQQPG